MPRRRAFTMVELLVVIGIIVLLIALLMPALSKAREAANAVTCSSHVKTLTNAFLLFANDNDNHLPGTRRTWRGGDSNPNHWDWLFGEYAAWDEYPGNTMVQRMECGPQYGTIWKYVNDYNVYLCPSLNNEKPGSGLGSNGRYDYAAFAIFCGASIRSVRPISQLHRPCLNQYTIVSSTGQPSVVQVSKPLPGPDMTDPNIARDPMTATYLNFGYAGLVENLPTPLVCQEEPGISINFDPEAGGPFVPSPDPGDDDWWEQMDGAHARWDEMAHCHGGGSYYGAIDGSVQFVIEPDTNQVTGTWGTYPTGTYGQGSSLWWQKGPASNIPRQLNWDCGAWSPDNWVTTYSGWNYWSKY